jgi:hypothetical protein
MDKYAFNSIGAALKGYEPELELMELAGLTMPDLLGRLSNLPSDSVVLYSPFFVDGITPLMLIQKVLDRPI